MESNLTHVTQMVRVRASGEAQPKSHKWHSSSSPSLELPSLVGGA
jgi:hypothetical protein